MAYTGDVCTQPTVIVKAILLERPDSTAVVAGGREVCLLKNLCAAHVVTEEQRCVVQKSRLVFVTARMGRVFFLLGDLGPGRRLVQEYAGDVSHLDVTVIRRGAITTRSRSANDTQNLASMTL